MTSDRSSEKEISDNSRTSRNNQLQSKLKERLGYLGIYYNRNSEDFFGNLSKQEQENLLERLKKSYLQIILRYFHNEEEITSEIDEFVNEVFFRNFPIYKIVEIHMELIEELAHQFKLEGLHEEVLLDYRLTLIDVLAHIGEMYRCSIPTDPSAKLRQ